MRLIILTLACKELLISDRCHVRFATLVDRKRGVRDGIKYTLTNLKIVRQGIARTHGWIELPPTVPASSSHRSSTVHLSRRETGQQLLLIAGKYLSAAAVLYRAS